jgi:hypothetical protein
MPKAKAIKPYCNATLTEAALRALIINALRRVSMHWKPKSTAIKRAYGGKKINPDTGKEKGYYICEETGAEVWLEEMRADHIEPVVPMEWGDETEFLGYNFNEYLRRLFVEQGDYQAITKEAHQVKSNAEKKERAEAKKKLAKA